MSDKSKVIFGNRLPSRSYAKAVKSKEKFKSKFGDDSGAEYRVRTERNEYIGDIIGVRDVLIGATGAEGAEESTASFDKERGIIVGNIRMGFGHYRISMAMASCANALGYVPYWMDLNSYPDTTCTKVISAQNDLYSMGSRISQRSRAFNKLVWEPMNYEGFRKLSYNASDQMNAELMAPVFKDIPKDMPLVATHVWPAQAAVHAGMKYVVNAIPDNWPMALHLAEGSLHTVQTYSSYLGYRTLNGMQGDKVLNPMPPESIKYTGHYIDHELVSNIEKDCGRRKSRVSGGGPVRFLLTIGGAGAQQELFKSIIKHLLPYINEGKAALYINVGDYRKVWEELKKSVRGLGGVSSEHFNDWQETSSFCTDAIEGDVEGVHAFWHENIFQAVYSTNLLMRSTDVMVTKPSELAFYPVPKLFIKRIGGHEMWGAIHSAEIGDGTIELRDKGHILQMIDLMLEDGTIITNMCDNIIRNKNDGVYDGSYKVIEEAFALRR